MSLDIPAARLHNQGVGRAAFRQPAEAVAHLAAVQAQDYVGAKWSLGLRMRNADDEDIDKAFNQGRILRTHVLRPTWHFVTPADIRWLLALTAPRVHQANGTMYRKMGLDAAAFKRSDAALGKALQGGGQFTRTEVKEALEKSGVATEGAQRLVYLLMHAELEGIICSGARRGKQMTYALLDERAPIASTLAREEALAELARRFFHSRGPATAHDFAKWSGLTVTAAREGLEAAKSGLQHEEIGGQEHWFPHAAPPKADAPRAHLMSIYDEYISGYKDRSAIVSAENAARMTAMENALTHIIVLDGQIAGTWRRILKKNEAIVERNPFRKFTKAEKQAIAAAAERFGAFFGLPVIVT